MSEHEHKWESRWQQSMGRGTETWEECACGEKRAYSGPDPAPSDPGRTIAQAGMLIAELTREDGGYDPWLGSPSCGKAIILLRRLANLLRSAIAPSVAPAPTRAQMLVAEQAEDEAIWFQARTAPELQVALRQLHRAVEADTANSAPTVSAAPDDDAVHPVVIGALIERVKRADRISDGLRGDIIAMLLTLSAANIEFKHERLARSKIDPITRMHNLCDNLAEHRRESPYNAEALELADESYKELCGKLKAAERTAAERGERIAAAMQLAEIVRSYHPGDDWCPNLRDALAKFDAALAPPAQDGAR